MPVPYEVRLISFTLNEDGTQSILDVVETSYHFAYHFTRKWVKDPEVFRFIAVKPPVSPSVLSWNWFSDSRCAGRSA